MTLSIQIRRIAAIAALLTSLGGAGAVAQEDQVLDRWSKRYSGDFISTDAFIETLYHSLSKRK